MRQFLKVIVIVIGILSILTSVVYFFVIPRIFCGGLSSLSCKKFLTESHKAKGEKSDDLVFNSLQSEVESLHFDAKYFEYFYSAGLEKYQDAPYEAPYTVRFIKACYAVGPEYTNAQNDTERIIKENGWNVLYRYSLLKSISGKTARADIEMVDASLSDIYCTDRYTNVSYVQTGVKLPSNLASENPRILRLIFYINPKVNNY